jgi:undecaprenyl-phosphate 4-deoxy-4-formamido-L-arabinose transferase
VELTRNFGQHAALLCGIRMACHAVTVTLDDDLQHPPEHIPRLLAALAVGHDVVYGAPETLPHSPLRNLFSRSTKWMLGRAMGVSRLVDIGAYRAFRTEVREAFDDFRGPNPMVDVLLSWGTTRFGSIRVAHEPRPVGQSGYSLRKLFDFALLLITGFTTGPLRLASWVGFGFTLFGVVVFVYAIVRGLVLGSVPGFPFLASIISLFSGAQLFAIGIIGEYLARIFHRTTDRPTYVQRHASRSAAPSYAGRSHLQARLASSA